MKVAAILIVKGTDNEAPHLDRCLGSIKDHVDGIFLNLNHQPGSKVSKRVRAIAEKYTDNIIETEWHNSFAEARNENLAQVPKDYEWVIWLDTDDTVDKPKKIRRVAEESEKFDCVFVNYDYDHDEFGNVTTQHLVGRLFKNNGSQYWNPKTKIHETLVDTRASVQGMTKDFRVIHHADTKRTQKSFERNIKMLERQLQDENKDPDPRTFYYLGSTYMDAGDLESAKQLFNDYLTLSGWDQERCVALTKLGRIYLTENNRAEARKHFAWAHSEDPASPDPLVELASIELELEQFNKARLYLEQVDKMEQNPTTLEINPLSYTFRTYILLAECYLNMGGKWIEKAEIYAKKALKYKKTDKKVKEYVDMVIRIKEDRITLQKVVAKFKDLRDEGKKEEAQKLLDDLPEHLADNVVISQLRQADNPYKWPNKSIAIMTGDTAIDEWGPWSLREGIGGSEEAIIRLAPQLSALGYKVVVYGKPGSRTGLHGDVMWRNYWDCNLKDEFDIFIAWRNPFIFDHKIQARKSYLWLHDVMEPGEFTPARLANLHKVIVLSKYHRSLFPMIPAKKILLSGNGIDPEEFTGEYPSSIAKKLPPQYRTETLNFIKRDPRKILYASSHVRGLAYLYKIWPEVKKVVPEATLDVYYGRESYDKVHKGNPERMKWMDDLMATAKGLEGVTDHGKVSQDKIIEAGFRSGIWAYPCPFPEIYCITAIKSQASGAVPVASNYAALDETIQFGHKQALGEFDEEDLQKYKKALIWWLQHPEEQEKIRPEMMKWARSQSWKKIGSQWVKDFESGKK